MHEIYYLNAEDMKMESFASLIPWIDPEKAEKIWRLPERRAKISLAAELLMRYGIWKSFGIAPDDIRTAVDESGKPYLLSHEGVYFNISHSGSRCVCIVGDRPVGIDLQEMRHADYPALADRVFGPREMEVFRRSGGDAAVFFRLWARKEALVKLTGEGLRTFGTDEETAHEVVADGCCENCWLYAVIAAEG